MDKSKIDFFGKKAISISIFLIFSLFTCAQKEFKGVVYDEVTGKPLESVVIYLDGTTKGTVTNAKGVFLLEVDVESNETLIISYLGYQTIALEQSQIKSPYNIIVRLKEQLEPLEPVYLEKDPWSRELKMRIFKENFIGPRAIQKTCVIENEEDVELFYSSSKNTLFASSYVPLKIVNEFLGYRISYNLMNFEVKFGRFGRKENPSIKSVYFLGTSFFKDDQKNVQKYLRRREKTYKGSILHFMRSLVTNSLNDNKYKIYYKGLQIPVDSAFHIKQSERFAQVLMKKPMITTMYKESRATDIFLSKNGSNDFYIDGFGNHSPPTVLLFNGYMGSLRVGKMIPLDYGL